MSTGPLEPPVSDPPTPDEVAETIQLDFPGSDIVLRSCDSHNFHVLKFYIALSSPVLREIIRNVSSTSDIARAEEPEPLPVIELPESGAILHSLLTLIFPILPVLPSATDKVIELLAVAQKYQMDSVLSHVRGIIGARNDPPFIRPESAFHIYFLAQRQGLHQEALQAARVTLRLPPMVIEDLGDKLEASDVTGACLYELWKYHECIRSDLKSGIVEFRIPGDVKTLRCRISRTNPYQSWSQSWNVTPSFPLWVGNYLESIADAPHLFDLFSFENAWARHIQHTSASCSCVGISSQFMRSFWEALTAVVQRTIERVRRDGASGLRRDNLYEIP